MYIKQFFVAYEMVVKNVNIRAVCVLQVLSSGVNVDGLVTVNKYVVRRPHTWQDCVAMARLKLEKYFNHRAQQLLHSFPLDTHNKDGSK